MRSLFNNISEQEKRFLLVGSCLLALMVGYFLIYEPMKNSNIAMTQRLKTLTADLLWMRQAKHLVVDIDTIQNIPKDREGILVVVDRAIQQADLKKQLKRMQPDGEERIRLWFEKARFSDLILWLERLSSEYGVHVSMASIDRHQEPGLVDVQLILATPH